MVEFGRCGVALALPCCTQAITEFFNDAVTKGLGKPPPPGGTYVINVYINHERRFAFVEFGSIPLTTACMAFGTSHPIPRPGLRACGHDHTS